jgi:hypothetical protein
MTVLSGALATALVAALAAGPAGAQAPAVVAGPLPNGATLSAFDRGGKLCLQTRGPTIGAPTTDCLDQFPDAPRHVSLASVTEETGGRAVWFAAVPAGVATAELVFANGARLTAPTSAGPAYHGRFAGRVRFLLLAAPNTDEPFLTRFLGADGRVVGAVGDPLAPNPVLERPTVFASGRAGGARWRAQAFVEQQLRRTPLEPDRLERVTCVGLGPGRTPPLGGPVVLRAQACADEGPLHAAVVPTDAIACRADGTAVAGFVAPRVARLVAVRGDGRREPVAVHALPAAYGGRRAFAFAEGRDTAVRRLEALDASGRRIATVALRLAPGSLACGGSASFSFFSIFGSGPLGSHLTPPPGPPRLLAADDGVRLCFSIGRFAPDGADCALPPQERVESRVLRQTTPAGTLVAGVVTPDVVQVRVHLGGGATVTVPTTPSVPGYTGRYAGAVRFFSLPLAHPRRAPIVDLVGAGGRRLGTVAGADFAFPPSRTVLRAGGVRIRASAARGVPCISVGAGECGPTIAALGVTATCAPRRLVVTALLDRRATGLDIGLRGGRSVTARIVRLPAGGGVPRRLAVVVLPAGATPVRAVIRHGRTRRASVRPLALPPAADQCGYDGLTGLPGSAGVGLPEPE